MFLFCGSAAKCFNMIVNVLIKISVVFDNIFLKKEKASLV